MTMKFAVAFLGLSVALLGGALYARANYTPAYVPPPPVVWETPTPLRTEMILLPGATFLDGTSGRLYSLPIGAELRRDTHAEDNLDVSYRATVVSLGTKRDQCANQCPAVGQSGMVF